MTSRVPEVHNAINNRLRNIDPLWLVLGAISGTIVYMKVVRLYRRSEEPLIKRLSAYAFSQLRRLPMVKAKIEKELYGAKREILETIHKDDSDRVFITGAVLSVSFRWHELPKEGLLAGSVLELAKKYEMYGRFAINEGRVSGAVYTDRLPAHIDLLAKTFNITIGAQVYSMYAFSNPLHPDVFPGARKMEAETIRMVLNLYNAPPDSSGSLTTGGT
ncbi:unnamed protein product, partial [Strongylus vulgaris]